MVLRALAKEIRKGRQPKLQIKAKPPSPSPSKAQAQAQAQAQVESKPAKAVKAAKEKWSP